MKKIFLTTCATMLLAGSVDAQTPTPDNRKPLFWVDEKYLYEYKDNLVDTLTASSSTAPSTRVFPTSTYGKNIIATPTWSWPTWSVTHARPGGSAPTTWIPTPAATPATKPIPPTSVGTIAWWWTSSPFDRAGNKTAGSATDLITDNARMIQEEFLEIYGQEVAHKLGKLQREALLIKEFSFNLEKLEQRIAMKDSLDGSGFFHWLKKDKSGNSLLKEFSIKDAEEHIKELKEYIQWFHVNRELWTKDLNTFLIYYADKDLSLTVPNVWEEPKRRISEIIETNDAFLTEMQGLADEINIIIPYIK